MYKEDVARAGTFLARSLEQVLPTLYERRYPELWGESGIYFPSQANLDPGATQVTAELFHSAGNAAIYAGASTDIPLANTSLSEDKYPAFMVVQGFSYSILELNQAAKTGHSLQQERMRACDRGLKERVHKIAVFGSKLNDATGYFNNPEVTVDNSSFNPATATAQEHIDFVGDAIAAIEDSSNLTERVNSIFVTKKLHQQWQNTALSGTGQSVLSYLMDTFGNMSAGGALRRIVVVNECKSGQLEANGVHVAGTDKDRAVFASEGEATSRSFYAPIYTEPQESKLNFEVYAYCGTTPGIVHYPGGMRYVDYGKQ